MIYNSFKGARSRHHTFLGFIQAHKRQIAYTGAGLSLFYVANLEKVPQSGRYRFMIVPRSIEMKVGNMAYRQTMSQFGMYLLPPSSRDVRRVSKVMRKIIGVTELNRDDINWEVNVINGDFPPNAFVLPGGKVFVFRSMLNICRTDDELAAVLSHETAHQVCRHTAECLTKAPLRWTFAILMQVFIGAGGIDNLLLSILFELPASRQMEREADEVGVKMLAKACYNPRGAVNLWKKMLRMETQQGQSIPEFLSTHPASQSRIEDMQKILPIAEQIKEDTCPQANQFLDFFGASRPVEFELD